jgi:hypothetical protein
MTYNERVYPAQKFLDHFSRQDELMVEQIKLLKQMLAALGTTPTTPVLTSELVDRKKVLELGQYVPYVVKTLDMTTAQTDYKIEFDGDNLLASSDGSLSGVTIKFNNQNNDAFPLQYFIGKKIPFSRMFISWTAQPAKHLYIAAGRQGEAEFDLYSSRVAVGSGKQTLFNVGFAALPAGTYYTSWLNLVAGQRAVMFITNMLDQPVNIQAIGHITEIALPPAAGNGVADIGIVAPVAAVAAGMPGVASIGVSDVYWHPYIACEIVIAGVATAGNLLIEAVVQG